MIRSSLVIAAILVVNGATIAQITPALRPGSGMSATTAIAALERDGPRPAGPRAEANGMNIIVGRVVRTQPAFRFPDELIAISSVQEVLFLTETRPVRVRMNVKVAGASIAGEWKQQVRKLFEFFDRDGDGELNSYESEFVFSNRGVTQMIALGSATPAFNEPGRSLRDFDRDDNGRVSFDEFLAYYNPSAQRLVTLRPNGVNRDAFADTLTEELFKLLDRNRDGKLSKEELAASEALLTSYDGDEDECLAALELVPDLFTRGRTPMPTVVRKDGQRAPAAPADPLQVYQVGTIPESIIETLLTRYDKDKNLRLTKDELGADDTTFARLDRNSNGELSVTELLLWKDGPPDLDIELILGAKPSESSAKVLAGPDGKPAALSTALKTPEPGKAFLRVGNQQLEFNTYVPQGVYARQVDAAVANFSFPDGGKGYVLERDIAGPQYQYLRVLFDVIDRDGDGKMTRAEYDAYFRVQRAFQNLPLSVAYASQMPSLFQLLDTDGDGRLSIRELRNAHSRMRDLESGNGEVITRAAIQSQGTIQFGRSTQVVLGNQNFPYNPRMNPPSQGPLWFRKMDRNADGEISRSEFLGTAEEFAKLDADGDGRVGLKEAEALRTIQK